MAFKVQKWDREIITDSKKLQNMATLNKQNDIPLHCLLILPGNVMHPDANTSGCISLAHLGRHSFNFSSPNKKFSLRQELGIAM